MNPHDAIEYLKKQGDFLSKRALESTTEVSILSYASRADMCYTLASALAILFGAASNAAAGSLGDAEDKAKALTSARD